MAHAQKPDFVFRRNGRVYLNRRGRHFSRLLAAEVCASTVVMLDTPCCEVVWWVLAIHYIRQFPLHFPSRASPYAITFQLDSTSFKSTRHDCVNVHYVNSRVGHGNASPRWPEFIPMTFTSADKSESVCTEKSQRLTPKVHHMEQFTKRWWGGDRNFWKQVHRWIVSLESNFEWQAA